MKVYNNISSYCNNDCIEKEFNLSDYNITVNEFKEQLIKFYKINLDINDISVSYYTIKDKLIKLSDINKKLNKYENFSDKSIIVIDKESKRIPYKYAYLIVYIGPILIITYQYFSLYFEIEEIYKEQHLFYFCNLFHFLRRIFETLFVQNFEIKYEKYSTRKKIKKMSVFSFIKGFIYYWGILSHFCGNSILSVTYTPYFESFNVYLLFILLYIHLEIKNLSCHLILSENDSSYMKLNNIPKGEGFDLITCANYFWEFSAFVILSVIILDWRMFIFIIVTFFRMKNIAVKRHKRLLKKNEKYYIDKYAFIPFII